MRESILSSARRDPLCGGFAGQIHGVSNTPLSPFIHSELLRHKHVFVDGTLIESTGFSYTSDRIGLPAVRAMVEEAIAGNHFPAVLAAEGEAAAAAAAAAAALDAEDIDNDYGDVDNSGGSGAAEGKGE